MATEGYGDTKLESECRSLAFDIDEGIKEHGIYEHDSYGKIFVYETDGMGNMLLASRRELFFVGEIPGTGCRAPTHGLLSAPYLGYVKADNEIYQNTRRFILSHNNPWYFEGSVAKGIGSPHTGTDKIWHIALIMQALTSTDEEEVKNCISMITNSHAGAYLMHESFNKNDDTDFTRPWFAWANSLFAELMIRLAEN